MYVLVFIFLWYYFFLYILYFIFFFFFFSSRRRHTRCLSDWSSDVCSSDLSAETSRIISGASTGSGAKIPPCCRRATSARSEERRVGKECRSRWSADH